MLKTITSILLSSLFLLNSSFASLDVGKIQAETMIEFTQEIKNIENVDYKRERIKEFVDLMKKSYKEVASKLTIEESKTINKKIIQYSKLAQLTPAEQLNDLAEFIKDDSQQASVAWALVFILSIAFGWSASR